MTSNLNVQSIRVNTKSQDREGRLVLAGDKLIAVLVRLDGSEHEELRGWWLLEAGFGPCESVPAEFFANLEDAQEWITGRLYAAAALA